MKICKQVAFVVAVALSMTVLISAHGDDSQSQTQTTQNYDLTHQGTVLTVIREDGTPAANATVQVKTEANDPNSTLAQETTDEQGAYDYSAYIADDAAILRVSDGSVTIIYYLLTDTYSYDSKGSKDGSGQQSVSIDPTMVAYVGSGTLALVGLGTLINVKTRAKHDPELGDLD